MFNNPFREEATESRNKRQKLDHLLRVTAPRERIVAVGIGMVILAVAGWVLFGSIERSVTLDGLLIAPGARYDIVAREQGHLLEVLIAAGDRVEAGETVARQTVPELDREIEILRNRMDLLKTEAAKARGGAETSLEDFRAALLQMEARRAARESIVSQAGGEVMALRRAPGEFLRPGAAIAQILDGDGEKLTAALRVGETTARRIRPGMGAEIRLTLPDGATRELQGEVTGVDPGPLPDWLAALPPSVRNSLSRINLDIKAEASLAAPDGTPCRVRIRIGRQSPIALFNPIS